MATFDTDEMSWATLDYAAIVLGRGFVLVGDADADACRRWFEARRYVTLTLDCGLGLDALLAQITDVFRWEDQFGYVYRGHSLDALNDGFEIEVPDEGGVVLELLHPEAVFATDPYFTSGLLAIARSYSRRQLAAGRRFVATWVVGGDADINGICAADVDLPICAWPPGTPPRYA